MRHDVTRTGFVPVLPQINPLPGTERQSPAGNRYAEVRRRERRFDVPRHIIRTFVLMCIERIILTRAILALALRAR